MPTLVSEQPMAEVAAMSGLAQKSGASLYGFAIFCGAFLLFQVQLILGKYALPWFGGAPAVWTTCMLFFQLLLLGGYFYSHAVSRLSLRRQSIVHVSLLGISVGLMVVGSFFWKTPLLPGPSWRPSPGDSPVLGILSLLTVAVGLPYLCLSTTGPLLQSWFARAHTAESPYRLYALSNAGSLLGLITYPFVFEPNLRLHTQAWLWAAGYIAFAAACIVCARKARLATAHAPTVYALEENVAPPTRFSQALWFLLPACASVMLLATTNLLCQEVAVVPFLWVLPLSLYLLSFIVCFDNPKWYLRGLFQILMAIGLPTAILALLGEVNAPVGRQVLMLSLVLLGCCMVCHGELVRLKPQPALLTRFYLLISAGGAAGGIFVVLVAPQIFTGFWEFHFGLIACVVVAILALIRDRGSWWYRAQPHLGTTILLGLALVPHFLSRHITLAVVPEMMYRAHYYPILTALALVTAIVFLTTRNRPYKPHRFNFAQIAAVAVLAAFCVTLYLCVQFDRNREIRRDRNFYSALQIQKGPELNSLELRHGQISHGFQSRLRPKEPTLYYARTSGIGRLLGADGCSQPCPRHIGVIGLGAGTLAAYGRPGDTMKFYELNPQVIAYSEGTDPYFTFLHDSSAKIETVLGDARLSLEREFTEKSPQNFDVLVIDAFSSDAIPAHLLTSEALDVYLEHLRGPNSILAFHISNKVLDLRYVLAALAAQKQLAVVRVNKRDSDNAAERSDWVMLARNPQALQLNAFEGHIAPMPKPDGRMLWTDDYSNLFRVLLRR
jgi:spermidine synthase